MGCRSNTVMSTILRLILAAALLCGLVILGRWNYVVFHSVIELSSIGVAMGIFMIAWNVRRRMDNDFLLFIALAYGAVALLDLVHTLAYDGMGAIRGITMDPPTQLWIAARYLQSLSLLIAPLWLTRRLPLKTALVGLALIDALVLLSIFRPWPWMPAFPQCYLGVPRGLTPFKVVSEYIIAGILLAAVGVLWWRRARLDKAIFVTMVVALFVTMASEIAFTHYVSVNTASNMIGHLLKAAAMYLTYKALIEAGLKRPFDVLFHSLSSSERRFRTLTMATFEGIAISEHGRVLDCNDQMARMLGYTPQEVVGQEATSFIHPADREQVAASMRLNKESLLEIRMVRKDGSIIVVEVHGQTNDDQSHPTRFTAVRNITQRKLAEEALVAAKISAEQAKTVAESASQAKDHFLAALSHELRTPLTPVLLAVETIEKDGDFSPEIREDLAMVHRNLELEVRLIDDLLDLNRVVHGKIELHVKHLDLHSKLKNVMEICRGDIQSKGLQVDLDLSAASHFVDGDGGRMQQVFWNLLKNAIKFTPEAGTITVRTRNPRPDAIRVEVADSGVGIDAETIPRLFAPFEQGSREVTKHFGGLGLGLAICRNLIELHGGSISAHSPGKGQGSIFVVQLPTVLSPTPGTAISAAPADGEVAKGSKLRILLVEDHADTRRLMARLLTGMGHTVTTAASVGEALAAAEAAAGEFDLVLSDLGLPDGSGHDLMRQLRGRWHLRGIALSGFGMEEDIIQSCAAGFVDHLTKPVHLGALQAAISRAAGGTRADSAEVVG